MNIVLYSTNCPKCKQLEKLLDNLHYKYEVCTDVDCMVALGMKSAPNLQVDGKIMDFATAWKWLREQQEVNK